MIRRRHPLLIVAVVGCLLSAACGTQVSDTLRQQAAAAALGQPGRAADGGLSSATGLDPASATGPGRTIAGSTGKSGLARTGPGAVSGPGSASGPVATRPGATGTVGAPAPAGGNGGATDVGITADTITLGNVSDLTGPQPGLFQPAVDGTNAYLAYVNSQGGLFGRKLKIAVADSQTSCAGDQSGHQQLVDKAFAFTGSFSLFDSCGAAVLKQHPDIPDAHLAVTQEANAIPNNFSINPVGTTLNNGGYTWAKQKFGPDVIQHAAFLYANLPAITNTAALMKKAAESTGWKFDYERAVGPTETDFTADVVQMRQKGIKMFLTLFNSDEMANFKSQADQQNFAPVIMGQLMYDQSFFKKLGGSAAAEGIYGNHVYSLFFSPEDAAAIPSVALFQKWYAQVSGGAPADSFAASSWAETNLLVTAMRRAGPRLTRKTVLQQLHAIGVFDAEGFVAAANPGTKEGPKCYLLWQIRSGRYVRVDEPAKAFRCDGEFA